MQSFFINYKASRIHYQKAGRGARVLFCFHGYGESVESFAFLQDSLETLFTILAIDMPFHGQTEWKEGLQFEPATLVGIMEQICLEQSVPPAKIQVLGYSMGGRIALSLLELIPEKMERLLLIAPDGLDNSRWYNVATQYNVGNKLFKYTMQHPGWFLGLMRIAHGFRLVNQSIHKFAISHISDRQVRTDLYRRWTTMRHFHPAVKTIRSQIASRKIPVELLYGRYDRMIRHETGAAFIKGIEPTCQLTILPSGHQLLQPKNLDLIISLL
ncbi:MAG TPA: alpha/beta hydrolase [Puia sp.]|nr:alpha/beta hydrolase [Puia sp.]